MNGPLAGVQVVDLSRLLPGAYATCVLADLGAEVLKVEQPGTGDGLRAAPPYDADGVSGAHALLNRGKRSLTLDLKDPDGRAVLLDLLAGADVLVDSFRPGVTDRLDLGRAVLEGTNPRLVHVAITFRGHSSAGAERAGHDINAQALAGLLELADGPDGGPALPYLQAADHVAGMQAVIAVLAALRARDVTGTGSFCDVAMVDAAYSLLGLAAGGYAAAGAVPGRRAALTGGLACYGLYTCADARQVAVGALEPVFFARLLAALGLPGELLAQQYVPAAQPELRARLADVLAGASRDSWVERLAEVDCCVTPVRDVAEAMTDDAAGERGLVVRDGFPFGRLGPVPAADDVEASDVAARPAPRLGADTDAVLARLGRSPGQTAALRARGVV